MAQETATVKATKPDPTARAKHEQARNGIAEWTVTLLLLLFGTTTLVQAFVIPTGSMEDTLLIGDHLLVDKLAYAPEGAISKYLLPYEEPKHGDIIVFRYPADISQTFVKRVIGVPGDHLKMVNRIVYRNGVPLNEPYVYHKFPYDPYRDNFPGEPSQIGDRLQDQLQRDMLEHHVVSGEVIVPPDSYFAMGDNRDNSTDSRVLSQVGYVPFENIIGRAQIIFFSIRGDTHAWEVWQWPWAVRWDRLFTIVR